MDKLILEEIQRMKLLSKYDNSKTLSEQAQTPEQAIAQQIYKVTSQTTGTNEKGLVDAIKQIKSATQLKQVDDALAAMSRVGGISATINDELGNSDVPTVRDIENHLKTIGANVNSGLSPTAKTGNFSGGFNITHGATAGAAQKGAEAVKQKVAGGNKQAAKPVATPPELKDIKAFQDWLDTNAKGWATGYKEGIINKGQNGGGYGKFGPRTQKAWATYKDQFLKGGTTAQTPPEIEGEDNTQTLDPNEGEFGGGAATPSAEQPTKVETPPTNDQAVTLQGNPKSAITTGQPEKPTSAIYGQEYKASDGKTYVWSGTEYQVKA